jgi:hypothetical protein
MATHVVRDIEMNGPPRSWWCMGFEAFNQTIKSMFRRSNYKSATLSVARFWSISTARALRRGKVSDWFQDSACAASELTTDLASMCEKSELMMAACNADVVAAQQLHSFNRGSVNITQGAWVLVESATVPGESFICQISDMVQLFMRDACCIRMLAREAVPCPNVPESVWMSVPSHEMLGNRMVIDLESVHISELHAVRCGSLYQFRYVW